jgi:hypothetical protein
MRGGELLICERVHLSSGITNCGFWIINSLAVVKLCLVVSYMVSDIKRYSRICIIQIWTFYHGGQESKPGSRYQDSQEDSPRTPWTLQGLPGLSTFGRVQDSQDSQETRSLNLGPETRILRRTLQGFPGLSKDSLGSQSSEESKTLKTLRRPGV